MRTVSMSGVTCTLGTVFALSVTLGLGEVGAQVVQGIIQEELTERPLPGAEVLLLTDEGTVVATTRSGGGGRFAVACSRSASLPRTWSWPR